MFFKTNGVVLKTNRSVNNDIFMTILTEKAGKIEGVANGAKRTKSQLSACSKAFVHGEFVFNMSGSMPKVVSCDLIASHYRLMDDLDRLAYGNYLLELCHLTTHLNVVDHEHYRVLVSLLQALMTIDVSRLNLIRLIYLAKLTCLTGHRPNLKAHCSQCEKPAAYYFFEVNTGQVTCKRCLTDVGQVYKLSPVSLNLLEFLVSKPVDEIIATKIHPDYLLTLIKPMEAFVQYHMNIVGIHSKVFIEQLL